MEIARRQTAQRYFRHAREKEKGRIAAKRTMPYHLPTCRRETRAFFGRAAISECSTRMGEPEADRARKKERKAEIRRELIADKHISRDSRRANAQREQ